MIATDASADQLARATPHPRVVYRRATAERSGLPAARAPEGGGGVDLAVAAQAAHWFDVEAYFDEVRRVTAPDGAIALVSYGPTRISPALDPVFERFRVQELAPFWSPERRHVEDGYRSLPFPFDELDAGEIPGLEIRLAWTLDELLSYVGTWSALRGMESAEAARRLADLRARLARAWGKAGAARRPVTWPLAVRAGHV